MAQPAPEGGQSVPLPARAVEPTQEEAGGEEAAQVEEEAMVGEDLPKPLPQESHWWKASRGDIVDSDRRVLLEDLDFDKELKHGQIRKLDEVDVNRMVQEYRNNPPASVVTGVLVVPKRSDSGVFPSC